MGTRQHNIILQNFCHRHVFPMSQGCNRPTWENKEQRVFSFALSLHCFSKSASEVSDLCLCDLRAETGTRKHGAVSSARRLFKHSEHWRDTERLTFSSLPLLQPDRHHYGTDRSKDGWHSTAQTFTQIQPRSHQPLMSPFHIVNAPI